LGIDNRWRTRLSEYGKMPVRSATALWVEGFALLGRFFAGVNGVGAAIAISITFSAYTSLATVDSPHICLASQFVSLLMRDGSSAAWFFFWAGFFAVAVAAVPKFVRIWHNRNSRDPLSESVQPVLPGMETSGLSEWTVVKISIFAQIIPGLVSVGLFSMGMHYVFGSDRPLSASAIRAMWQGFAPGCTP
jgi:hypothetical protein